MIEYECRKCGSVVSFEQYSLQHYCPQCGTYLRQRRQQKHWLFQFNPTTYNWFDWIKENRGTEQWVASQHVKEIRKGDKVALWASGNKRGIYAVGEIVENPIKRPLNPDQEKYWTKKIGIYKFLDKKSVVIRYKKVFVDNPLLEDRCRKDPILSNMEILKQPQGTDFPLTKKQWNRIVELSWVKKH